MEDKWRKLDAKGRERTTKIGKAAARLFSRLGYIETTMDAIAGAAKMSKGGMYYYFSTKQEVLFFVLSNYMDEVLKDLEDELNAVEGADERLKHIISRHISLYSKNLSEAKVLLHEAKCLPSKYFKVIAEKEKKYFKIVSRVLSETLKGSVKKGEMTTLSFTLFGMCNWIYSWYDPKGFISPENLSGIIYCIFMNGINGLKNK